MSKIINISQEQLETIRVVRNIRDDQGFILVVTDRNESGSVSICGRATQFDLSLTAIHIFAKMDLSAQAEFMRQITKYMLTLSDKAMEEIDDENA